MIILRNLGRALSLFSLVASFSAHAGKTKLPDEGMWEFTNLPKKQLKERYGFQPGDGSDAAWAAWTKHLMLASLRAEDGGSSSFVSKDGLILTNHHVATDVLTKISTPGHDYIETGFLAKTRAEEVPATGFVLTQLLQITDVTERVRSAEKPGMTAAEKKAARSREIGAIEEELSEPDQKITTEVITLYNGGKFHAYKRKAYDDVRLVFAPEFSIAFFGGDPDNFEFPRYDLDMAIMRVYENGEPVHPEEYLNFSPTGASEGELTFVSGHPGSTRRMYTMDALAFLRDYEMPYRLSYLYRLESYIKSFSDSGPAQAQAAHSMLFSVSNSRKGRNGRMDGLRSSDLLINESKEAQLRAAIQADASLAEYADAWDMVKKAKDYEKKIFKRNLILNGQAYPGELFAIARTMVRFAAKLKEKKLEYTESMTAAEHPELETILAVAPFSLEFEEVLLSAGFDQLSSELGVNDPFTRLVLGHQSPQEAAAKIASGTRLMPKLTSDDRLNKLAIEAAIAYRKSLLKGGLAAIQSSADELIRLALLIDGPASEVASEYNRNVRALEEEGYRKISEALFKVKGTNQYPDATFTLRLAYGPVIGYTSKRGQQFPAMTTIGGAFTHETSHGAKEPFKLPASWHAAKQNAQLNLSTPLNFVTTADIIGGNSGSPVTNAAGQLVGLIFDGNIESLPNDYYYKESTQRSVSVHSAGMLEALRKVYGADALADELIGN